MLGHAIRARRAQRTATLRTASAASWLLVVAACQHPAPPPAAATVVEALRVGSSDTRSTFRATGEMHATVESNLAFRVDGKVVKRLVDVGDHVAAHAVLAQLDTAQAAADIAVEEAAYASAVASSERAKLELGRDRELFAHAAIPKAKLDDSEATAAYAASAAQSARAKLDIARESFSYTELRAGHAGTITARTLDLGQTVQAGVTVYSIAEDGPRDAVFRIDAMVANRIGPATPISIALVDDPNTRVDGRIREVAPTVDAGTESVRIKVQIDHPPARFTLGSPVVGDLTLMTTKTVTVPTAAIVSDLQTNPAVWVFDPATHAVHLRRIDVATFESKVVVVRSGLSDGELVVTEGANHLRPSQVVQLAKGGRP